MRIGILTDIHENTSALMNVFRLADDLKVDELACLGDIAGYDTSLYNHTLRSAKECVRLVRSNCRWVVPGNHDLNASRRIPEFTNGFSYPDNWFILNAQEKKKLSSGRVWCYENEAENDLSPDELEYLSQIPEYLIAGQTTGSLLFSHYIFPDFTGSTTQYAKRNHQMVNHWNFMQSNNIKMSLTGHSHNFFAGFAYKSKISFLHAFHSLPNNTFHLDNEPVVIMLPPLSGEKGKTGFSIIDTDTMKLSIIPTATP